MEITKMFNKSKPSKYEKVTPPPSSTKKTKLEVLIEFIKNKLNIERRQKGNFFKSWFIN